MSHMNYLMSALNLFGTPIIESPLLEPQPILQVSPHVPVSDAFRAEMNAWLLQRFGREQPMVVSTPRGLAMGPSVVRALKEYTKCVFPPL